MSIRDQILKANDRPLKALEVPEWGTTIYLPTFSAAELVRIEELREDDQIPIGAFATVIIRDENGNPIFAPEDAAELSKKNGSILARIVVECWKHNGIGEEALDEAKND